MERREALALAASRQPTPLRCPRDGFGLRIEAGGSRICSNPDCGWGMAACPSCRKELVARPGDLCQTCAKHPPPPPPPPWPRGRVAREGAIRLSRIPPPFPRGVRPFRRPAEALPSRPARKERNILFPIVFGLIVLAVAALTYSFLASNEGSAPARPAPSETTGAVEPPFRLPDPEPAPTPTPEDSKALMAQGNAAAREKRWKDALVLYERAQALSPGDRQVEEALATARRALSDEELLRRSAEALALRREWDSRLQGLRGSLRRAEDGGDFSAARTYARQILDMVPNDLPARAFQERDLEETRARADQAVLDLDEGGIRRLWEEYSNSWPGDLRASNELARSLRRLERARNVLAKAGPPSATP